MSPKLVQFALVGLFVALAVAEVVFRHSEPGAGRHSDARLVTNFGLTAFVLFCGGLIPVARLTSAFAAGRGGLGLANVVPLPWPAVLLAMLLLDSFAAYWVHRLMHKVPLLWRVHRVHHADSAVDVSTSLRNHPLELLITVPVSAVVVLAIGAPQSVVLAAQVIFVAATLWQHVELDLPGRVDRLLANIIITPRLHRVHHHPQRQLHDSNFGDSLVIWDRAFGTFRQSAPDRLVGLDDQRARADHLLDQIWSPLVPGRS